MKRRTRSHGRLGNPRLFGVALLALLGLWPSRLSARDAPAHPLLVGYFPQWGVYSQYFARNLVASGAAARLDQIDYAQGMIANNRCVIGDPNADLNLIYTPENSIDGKADDSGAPLRGNFHQLQLLRHRYPRLKMLISLEGKPESFAEAAKPDNRATFVTSCIDVFVRGHVAPGVEAGELFEGFDIDWEVPTPAQKDEYLGLLAEFRRQLDELHQGLKLTIALSAAHHHYDGFDMKAIAALVDEVNVMNYDYNGPWSHTTGILAPLYEIPGDPLHENNVDSTFKGYEEAGIPASKLLMGIPFYAYGWNGVSEVNHGLFQPGQAIHGDYFYSYIQSIQGQSKLYRDPTSQAPWLYDGKTFWTFEDAVSIRGKLAYTRQQKLGGVMIWELSNDSADGLLLKTVAGEIHRVPRERQASEPH